MPYDNNYSKLFYPHVSVFCKLLTNSHCCYCKRSTKGSKNAVCHHGSYKLPNGKLVKEFEFDFLGVLLFHVCSECHRLLHMPKNWIAPIGCHKADQKNTAECFQIMSTNWNNLVIHYKYKKDTSDWIWKAYF